MACLLTSKECKDQINHCAIIGKDTLNIIITTRSIILTVATYVSTPQSVVSTLCINEVCVFSVRN